MGKEKLTTTSRSWTSSPDIDDFDWFRRDGGESNCNSDKLAPSFAGAAVEFDHVVWGHEYVDGSTRSQNIGGE